MIRTRAIASARTTVQRTHASVNSGGIESGGKNEHAATRPSIAGATPVTEMAQVRTVTAVSPALRMVFVRVPNVLRLGQATHPTSTADAAPVFAVVTPDFARGALPFPFEANVGIRHGEDRTTARTTTVGPELRGTCRFPRPRRQACHHDKREDREGASSKPMRHCAATRKLETTLTAGTLKTQPGVVGRQSP